MEGKLNHQKNKAISCEEEDRISSLPDPLLHQILSSIFIYEAVQTCILSKRWRYLWTSLPNLHFDYEQFPTRGSHAAERRHFTSFVNQVLSLRDASDISNFSLLTTYDDPSLAERCVCYAACHNVKQLHLWARSLIKPIKLPPCFINSKSIRELTLVIPSACIPLDKPLHLPGLKTLRLEHFRKDSGNFITQTVANCPNLETLILNKLDMRSVGTKSPFFKISGAKIRKLELCYYNGRIFECYESEVEVSAPRLTSFQLVGSVSPVFSMGSLPCLMDVYVDVCPYPGGFVADRVKQRMPLNVMNLLGQLREANSVTMSWGTLENLAKDLDSFKSEPSPFHKLKHLKLVAPREYSNPTMALNVLTYLAQGSSYGDTLAVEFPPAFMKLLALKNGWSDMIHSSKSFKVPLSWLEEAEVAGEIL